MTPDEVRKLVGGYATGSLTEAQRTALFEAALEDQELFDELGSEQALKEVLDEPGARTRLLAALENGPHRSAWWMRPWPWASAAVTVAIAAVIVVSQRTPEPQQAAPVPAMKAPEPVAPAPEAALRKVSPPAPPPEPRKEQALADRQEAAPAFAAEGRVAAARAENLAAASAPSGFAFSYTVRADGFLEIVPAAGGFLSVTANDAVVFPSGTVGPGTPLRIPIPPEATSLVIAFSGTPGITGTPVRRDEASGTVTDQDPPNSRIVIQLFLTPATR